MELFTESMYADFCDSRKRYWYRYSKEYQKRLAYEKFQWMFSAALSSFLIGLLLGLLIFGE